VTRPGWGRFLRAYVKSMRPYYAFVTGIAGWVGVSFYDYRLPQNADPLRGAAILGMLFLAWGINQIFNDYLGLPEDRINAPHRPMVTGELPARPALVLSIALLVVVLGISAVLNPLSMIPVVVGVLLNVLYEYAKAWSLLGNVVFGLSIASCTAYGFLAAGPAPSPLFTGNRVAALLMVALLNGLMTYYTYFKDYQGDRAAGKATFVVKYGLDVARYAGIAGAFLPTAVMLFMHFTGWLSLSGVLYKEQFTFCAVMTVFLQLWTAVLYFRHPTGERTYFSLVTNIRACVAGQVALIAIFNGPLALYLLAASYVFIGFLFDLHQDARA
jgi:geranylgeranylglycerol-phosphate geranylgeranyltransferase